MTDGKKLPDRTPGPLGHNDAHDPSPSSPGELPVQAWGSPGEGQIFAKPPVRKVNNATPPRPIQNAPSAIRLDYSPMASDELGSTKKASIPIGGSSILARDGTSFLLHGNNRISVWRDGTDSTSRKGIAGDSIFRVWRVWSAPLDATSRLRIGSYSTGTNGHFTNDGTGGHLWVDVPGVTVSPERSKRKYRRHLIEFLVGVANRPDAGGLYFNVVIDETPDEYRVSMHESRRYDGHQWREYFPLGPDLTDVVTPTGPESRPTVAAPLWEPVATEDDLPVVLDYGGWHKFPKEQDSSKQ